MVSDIFEDANQQTKGDKATGISHSLCDCRGLVWIWVTCTEKVWVKYRECSEQLEGDNGNNYVYRRTNFGGNVQILT